MKRYTLRNNKRRVTSEYSWFQWNLAWAVVWVLGFVVGLIVGFTS